ncbi:MAG: DUF1049 domain-containing protein [Planctomycetes bacterium]|nr:DUF1049 domain-containing protein [Planctomycetota bacterium]
MKKLKLITAAVLAVLVVILVMQNTTAVDTKILFITVTMPRALLLLLTWLIGIAVGLLLAFAAVAKKDK